MLSSAFCIFYYLRHCFYSICSDSCFMIWIRLVSDWKLTSEYTGEGCGKFWFHFTYLDINNWALPCYPQRLSCWYNHVVAPSRHWVMPRSEVSLTNVLWVTLYIHQLYENKSLVKIGSIFLEIRRNKQTDRPRDNNLMKIFLNLVP